MKPFAYSRANNANAAVTEVTNLKTAKFLAGGTNLIDLMKEGVEQPDKLVDVSKLPLAQITELPDGGLRLGALARNSHTANHPTVRQKFPLVTQTILSGASGQLRNKATNGGNMLQRTRCFYFYDINSRCNKRQPGTGCDAIEGFNRIHAVLGASPQCIATYQGDMANSLVALDAVVRVQTANGERTIPIVDFHRLPGDTPQIDTNLKHGELITAIDLPASAAKFAANSYYLKIRDRASYAYGLVSVAAALEMDGNRIKDARVVIGNVAHKPWRSVEAEKILIGGAANDTNFGRAAAAALNGAKTYKYNEYKVEMGRRAIVRALQVAMKGGVA